MAWSDVWDFVTGQSSKDYYNLAKTGVAALSTYASWKDQQKKNEMQQAAYNDWMAQAEAAGHEARAAVDINYTPMTVSGTPTTKADVTDFTAVAARGGLMSIPNKQRKRYAYGPELEDIEVMDEETITPFDLQMEEGVNIGEQVKYETGNPREGAWSVWNSGGIDQELYEFDFEIFFDSGDWRDMLKGDVPMQELQGNTMMASADPMLQDEYDKYVFEIQEQGGTPMSIEDFRAQAVAGQANGGIIGLRHGGRPGFYRGSDRGEFSLSERLNPRDPENELIAEHMQIGKLPFNITARILELNRGGKSYEDIAEITGVDIEDITSMLEVANNPDIIDPVDRQGKVDYNLWDEIVKERDQIRDRPEHLSYNAQGGRIGYNRGLVVNPGGYAGETAPPINDEVEDALMEAVARKFPNLNTEEWSLEKLITALQIGGVMGTEDADILDKAAGLNMITPESIGTSAQAVSRHRDYIAQGGRIGYSQGTWESEWEELYQNYKLKQIELGQEFVSKEEFIEQYQNNMAQGGRPGYRLGDEVVANTSGIGGLDGMLDLGGMEKDYRWDGGFVPIGEYEKKDDVPARLSKNEFVFTADAVRAAGGGSINKGAQRMYDTMKNLEAQPQSKRMTA